MKSPSLLYFALGATAFIVLLSACQATPAKVAETELVPSETQVVAEVPTSEFVTEVKEQYGPIDSLYNMSFYGLDYRMHVGSCKGPDGNVHSHINLSQQEQSVLGVNIDKSSLLAVLHGDGLQLPTQPVDLTMHTAGHPIADYFFKGMEYSGVRSDVMYFHMYFTHPEVDKPLVIDYGVRYRENANFPLGHVSYHGVRPEHAMLMRSEE